MAAQQDSAPEFLSQLIHYIDQFLLSIVLPGSYIQSKPAPETALVNI